ncbi:hypothetical protein [Cetobacterium sp.]|uniref:hypothetical protein n=1 Tax=Cetobacterium sp. TaxID=2071632 RepID=UPI003F3B5AE0
MKYLFYMFFCIFSYSYSYLQIYPTTFDKNIDRIGSSETYELSNSTQNKVRYIFYVEKVENQKDMSSWMEFYPKTMVLNPGEKKKLTLFIKAPTNSPKGEYAGVLGIKELPVVTETDIINKNKSINILTNLKIELAGFVGQLPLVLKDKNVVLNKVEKKLSGIIENTGEKRATLMFYLLNTKTKKEYYIGSGRVMSKKEFNLSRLSKIKQTEDIKHYNELIIKDKNEIVKRIKIK